MDSSRKASAEKPPTGGQQLAGGVAGKKRKKKKNTEKKTGNCPPSLVVHAMVPVEPHRSAGLSDGSGSHRSVYERCSSSSSIENSKPERKIGRFDFSSSDAMSVSLTSSSTAMEFSGASQSGSPLPSQAQIPFTRSTHLVNSSTTLSTDASSLQSVTGDTASSSTYVSTSASSSSEQCKITTDASACSMLESLRWEKECSDEEEEKERIELYKANRRKRYENALEERRTSVAAVKKPYHISSSESIS